MRYTKRNLPYHELIGLQVVIRDHTDPTLVGVRGRVIKETKNTLVIETEGGRKLVVPKFGGIFLFKIPKHRFVSIAGDTLIGRPEERLRRLGRW